MEFLANPLNFRGEPLETADIVERLQASGEQVIEVESASIGGIDTRVFDIVGAQGPMSVTWDPDSNADPGFDWFLSSRSRVWLVEHLDRGLLILTARAFDNVEECFR